MSQVAIRLRSARESANFATATEAATRFGWSAPTYLSHENGSRGVNVTTAKKYARAFKVSADWLLFGGDTSQRPEVSQEVAEGFQEDAAPFEHDAAHKSPMKSLFPTAKLPEIAFRAARHMPDLSVCHGDLIVCDLGTTGISGQLVIVQHIDPGTGETIGHTLRRYIPPFLIASTNGLTLETIQDDDPAIIIRFPVVGFIRQSLV